MCLWRGLDALRGSLANTGEATFTFLSCSLNCPLTFWKIGKSTNSKMVRTQNEIWLWTKEHLILQVHSHILRLGPPHFKAAYGVRQTELCLSFSCYLLVLCLLLSCALLLWFSWVRRHSGSRTFVLLSLVSRCLQISRCIVFYAGVFFNFFFFCSTAMQSCVEKS